MPYFLHMVFSAGLPASQSGAEARLVTHGCLQGASELAEALGELELGSPALATWDAQGRPILRGMPQAAHRPRHTRFTDEGTAVDSPGTGMAALRGLPAATGSHIRFADDDA